jgi:hypothetical protein
VSPKAREIKEVELAILNKDKQLGQLKLNTVSVMSCSVCSRVPMLSV